MSSRVLHLITNILFISPSLSRLFTCFYNSYIEKKQSYHLPLDLISWKSYQECEISIMKHTKIKEFLKLWRCDSVKIESYSENRKKIRSLLSCSWIFYLCDFETADWCYLARKHSPTWAKTLPLKSFWERCFTISIFTHKHICI